MFITDFKVKGCLHITNKEIQSIHATMTESMQLILGTNGAGKSAVCRLLTGWPPKPKVFKSGGFVEISGKLDNDTYLIRYDFNRTVKCTFMKNNEVLNDKGTTTVQKDLLKEHLRLDQDIYKLLTGQVRFSKLSVNERKRWIDKVSPIDMGYITKLHESAKAQARDMKGAIRVSTERMHKLQTNLDSLGLPEGIEEEYNALNEKFMTLSREHDQSGIGQDALIAKINTLNEHISNNLHRLTSIRQEAMAIERSSDITSMTELDSRLTYLRVEDNQLISSAEAIMTDVAEIDKILHVFKGPMGGNLEELKESQVHFESVINGIKEKYSDGLPYCLSWEHHTLASSMNEFEALVRKLATDLPHNVKPDWYSREAALKIMERKDELVTNIRNTEVRIQRVNDRLREMKNSKLIECDNCNHKFHLGFTTDDKRDALKVREEMGKEVEKLTEELNEIEDKVKQIHAYRESGRLYASMRSQAPTHSPFFNTVEEKGYLGTDPSKLNSEFMTYNHVIGDLRTCHISQLELDRLSMVIRNMANLGGDDLGSIKAKREALLAKRESLLAQTEENKKESVRLTGFRRLVFNQGELCNDVDKMGKEIEAAYGQLAMAAHNDILAEELDKVIARIATVRESVNKKEVINGVIQQTKEHLEEIIQKQKDWTTLIQVLSPERGLIAHQVNSYIGGFITMINQSINKVWTYPMEVQPCSVEDGGLNYMFPVSTPTRRSSPDDPSEASDGQQGMINFAFILAVYQCLDLTHLPLFTDELGKEFDEEHASRLIPFLNRLLDSKFIGRIFMVNHFQLMHGSLKNAEVLVLDEDNINVPVTANEHVKFNTL